MRHYLSWCSERKIENKEEYEINCISIILLFLKTTFYCKLIFTFRSYTYMVVENESKKEMQKKMK